MLIGKSPPCLRRSASRRQVTPLCQRGGIPPFGNLFPVKDRQRKAGRDFKNKWLFSDLSCHFDSAIRNIYSSP